MKKTFFFIVMLLFAVTSVSRAQNPVVDKYPDATIYVIDPQSGQEVQAQDDNAVLFKDAFIDLVNNTYRVKHIIKSPGHKSIVITQADPADGNSFQLVNQSKFLGSEIANYTFSYSVDQNTLYYLDPVSQTWQPEVVQGYNVVNMNNCLALGKFNELQPADANNNTDVQQTSDDNADQDVTADTPPPTLQDYEQPECPQDGYLWQPGYWAFNPGGGYYWVPGVWVAPPNEGLLWTPPYWGYEGNVYIFHSGYWGPHVGFYGGINYGYGYAGDGYYGGNWNGGHFRYNTAVVRVNTVYVHNVYVDRTVVHVGTRVNNVSFNGPGGSTRRPTERELQVNNENRIRDFHQDPKAASRVNTYHNNNGGNNQGNNGGRNNNANNPRNNNPSGSNNPNTNNAGNGNSPAGNNGGRNGNVYVPRNGSAPTNNNGGRNGNVYTPRNGNATNSNTQNTNSPRNGNTPATPTNGTSGHNGNAQGAPRVPGNGPAVPRGPGGHNGNSGNGGNNSPRNGNGGNGKNGGNNSGNKSKKDDKKGN